MWRDGKTADDHESCWIGGQATWWDHNKGLLQDGGMIWLSTKVQIAGQEKNSYRMNEEAFAQSYGNSVDHILCNLICKQSLTCSTLYIMFWVTSPILFRHFQGITALNFIFRIRLPAVSLCLFWYRCTCVWNSTL